MKQMWSGPLTMRITLRHPFLTCNSRGCASWVVLRLHLPGPSP